MTSEALLGAAEAVPDSNAEIRDRARCAALFAAVPVDKASDIAERPVLDDEALYSATGVPEGSVEVLDAIPRTAVHAWFKV